MVTSLSSSTRRALSSAQRLQFHRDGFLVVRDAWSLAAVTEVRQMIDELYQLEGRHCGAIPNLVSRNPALRKTAIFCTCLAIAQELLGRTTRYACDNALYKEPHGTHGTPWHQDGAFHGKHFPNNTIGVWVPLQDVTAENGCMQYIPLQKYPILLPHRPFYPNDRHSMMTDHADASQAIDCPLHAGDVAIHGPLTLHAAFVNQTDDIRRTWLLTFRPWGKWGTLAPSRLVQRARLIRNGFFHSREQ
jgi:ectoine hydroxylase-related dioxygenase (phytanoyl-CoA dioxygenase family)